MNEPTGKLNLDEAMGRKISADTEIKPTLRIKRSDLKVLRRPPEPKKKKVAFALTGAGVALALAAVLWFSRDSWIPFWQGVFPPADGGAGAPAAEGGDEAVEGDGEVAGDADAAVAGAEEGGGANPMAFDGPLPPPETLTYFSAAGWDNESFRRAVRHFNAGFDAYKAFLADDTSSRPLAVAETEAIETLRLLRDVAGEVPEGMRTEVAFDVLEARSLLAEVRRLARDPGASASAAGRKATPEPAAARDVASQPKVWKNPDYLEAARAYNRAVAKYKEFLADKSGRQALLKEIEDDAFAAAKKFESLKASAPAGIPLQDHITQCYKLISDCRRQQLESPVRPAGASARSRPARRTAP